MISLAFYWSLAISQFYDNKRKDFWQMFIHHILTLMLISFSWTCNFHRVGSLLLLVHDAADFVLEASKALKYAKLQKACDIVFGLFTITWVVTRLMIFPRIIYSCLFETLICPAYFLFNFLLISLLMLHIFWTYSIAQVILKSLKSGETEKDVRSSSSEDLTDDDDDRTK
jgi:sphingoid base N-palmitoyltransferase